MATSLSAVLEYVSVHFLLEAATVHRPGGSRLKQSLHASAMVCDNATWTSRETIAGAEVLCRTLICSTLYVCRSSDWSRFAEQLQQRSARAFRPLDAGPWPAEEPEATKLYSSKRAETPPATSKPCRSTTIQILTRIQPIYHHHLLQLRHPYIRLDPLHPTAHSQP